MNCSKSILFALLAMTSVSLMTAPALAAGKFASPVQHTFTLSFDDPAALSPGPTNFFTSAGAGFESFDDFDNSYAGEVANWGTFGGAPGDISAGVIADSGPNGTGDNAYQMAVTVDNGGWFAATRWQVKGLMLGNDSGGTVLDSVSGLNLPVPDMNKLSLTVPVKSTINGADFRINFDTGQSTSNLNVDNDGSGITSYVTGNVPGLLEYGGASLLYAPGSRVLPIGPTRLTALPADTWTTDLGYVLNENPTDTYWDDASFSPFNGRGPRSFQLTRVGVTYPGDGSTAGQVGEILVGSYSISGDDVLKYHAADFNYDEMVDDADIDMLFAAINALALNYSLPEVPDEDENNKPDHVAVWGVDQVPNVDASLDEKFGLTRTGTNVLDMGDVDELVLNILGTEYGDLDLDGVKEPSDRATLVANIGNAGGWADGDLNGDGMVTNADLAIYDAGAALLGDYNNNNEIDAADYTAWRDAVTAGSTTLTNDPTPGTVDESDFLYWRAHFGETLGSGSGAGTASLAAVPEPSALVLLATAMALLGILRQATRINH